MKIGETSYVLSGLDIDFWRKNFIKLYNKEVFEDYEDMICRVNLTQEEFLKILGTKNQDSNTQF